MFRAHLLVLALKCYDMIVYLDGKAVAVECSLKVLIKAWGLQGPILFFGWEKEASSIGQRQGLSRSIKKSLLTPAVETFRMCNYNRCIKQLNNKHAITMNAVGYHWTY